MNHDEQQRIREKLDKQLRRITNSTCGFSGCFNSIGKWGNDPSPFVLRGNNRCCDECNFLKVLPLRIMTTKKKEKDLKGEKTI